MNASIKSGTNNIHGSLWEYVRNDAFDIRQFFDGGSPVPKYRQNQFGATLGLPIIKNKLFFFGDLEANRIIFGETHSGLTVPTALMRTGNFSELLNASLVSGGNTIQLYKPNPTANGTTLIPNNRLDQSGVTLDPVALNLLSLFPLPNVGIAGQTYDNYTSQTNTVDNTFQWDTRMDWNISSKDQAFGRYSYNHEPSTHPARFRPILDGGGFGDTGQIISLGENFAGSETHVFTPTLTNEFRFGYNYGHDGGLQENGTYGHSPPHISDWEVFPFAKDKWRTSIDQCKHQFQTTFGSPTYYVTNEYENVYQILDNVTKVWGNHTLKSRSGLPSVMYASPQRSQPSRGVLYNFRGATGSDSTFYTGRQGVAFTGYGLADFLTNNSFGSASEMLQHLHIR